ncbi:VTT domain-containing protein [Crassaminicella profunda]|uniref:VTT domain-containing protein n=1 Tax=Crassaminicella profunda TaxID=1286698 RepID=UPI001CA6879B|nr:VTT domain-containing protein [Crassaminicella profunda]QZY53861.1 VTT domain-containing protein [Crassaminicella profunda]
MKKHKVLINILFIIIWILLFTIMRYFLKISTLADLFTFIKCHEKIATITFLILSIVRISAFLPGMLFMIIGGLLFNPMLGFTLSMVSMIVSESIIFMLAKISFNSRFINKINNKYPELMNMSKKYNHQFLALAILCPIAPTDLACFISSYVGLKYKSFFLTVIIANIPIIFIYTILGQSFLYSIYYFILIVVTFSVISIYLVKIWNRLAKPISE